MLGLTAGSGEHGAGMRAGGWLAPGAATGGTGRLPEDPPAQSAPGRAVAPARAGVPGRTRRLPSP